VLQGRISATIAALAASAQSNRERNYGLVLHVNAVIFV